MQEAIGLSTHVQQPVLCPPEGETLLKSQQPACACMGLSVFALLPQGDKDSWKHPQGGCEVGACSSNVQARES